MAAFAQRWSAAQAAERANYQLFLSELCDMLGVPRPDPATDDTAHNAYVFERAVTFHHRDGRTRLRDLGETDMRDDLSGALWEITHVGGHVVEIQGAQPSGAIHWEDWKHPRIYGA